MLRVSYGLLCRDSKGHVLLCKKRNSYEYNQIIYGHNLDNIETKVKYLSPDEKHRLLTMDYRELWNDIWVVKDIRYTNMYFKCESMFQQILPELRKAIQNTVDEFDVKRQWGFPKGGKKDKETGRRAAIREFVEETGYSQKDIYVSNNTHIVNYKGTDNRNYRIILWDAIYKGTDTEDRMVESNEIQRTRWISVDHADDYLLPHLIQLL